MFVLDKILIWAFTVQWCGHICICMVWVHMVWVVGTGTDGTYCPGTYGVRRASTYGVGTSCSGTLCAVFHS